MNKCVCGADPEVCYCAFETFHQPPPDDDDCDRIDMEDEDYDDDWLDEDQFFEMPIND